MEDRLDRSSMELLSLLHSIVSRCTALSFLVSEKIKQKVWWCSNSWCSISFYKKSINRPHRIWCSKYSLDRFKRIHPEIMLSAGWVGWDKRVLCESAICTLSSQCVARVEAPMGRFPVSLSVLSLFHPPRYGWPSRQNPSQFHPLPHHVILNRKVPSKLNDNWLMNEQIS